ncbi:MAG: hypothetical protein AAF636_09240 [Pseudomonadota bacterium]
MKRLGGTQDLLRAIEATPATAHRRMVALSGGPGSGKTTLAAKLAATLSATEGRAAVLPMDGFHLDNSVLIARGLLLRKGAPETFDLVGFTSVLQRAAGPGEVVHPVFDRSIDKAIAGAGVIGADCRTVIVEGNYLMLRAPGWEDLAPLWDISVALGPDMDTLHDRLITRWREHGLSEPEAHSKVQENDMPNARLIANHSAPSDYLL